MSPPTDESILIDSGYPDNGGRDRDRILHVVRDVAGLDHIDHAAVSHWHLDHYGNHASLAAMIPDSQFLRPWYSGCAAGGRGVRIPHRGLSPRITEQFADADSAGDRFNLDSPQISIERHRSSPPAVDVIANIGDPNPHADSHEPQPVDETDNAASLGIMIRFGDFEFLCCGDLTWNIEAELVTPKNPLGLVDLFMVTHHGLPTSNNPVFVHAIDPLVAVMCNGPTKGGHAQTLETLQGAESLTALYQLHRNVNLTAEQQSPAEFIANNEPTVNCEGIWVKASAAPDGEEFTVRIGEDGEVRTYECRD